MVSTVTLGRLEYLGMKAFSKRKAYEITVGYHQKFPLLNFVTLMNASVMTDINQRSLTAFLSVIEMSAFSLSF